jgi:anthranilate 1,2-dioxygenase small subunit
VDFELEHRLVKLNYQYVQCIDEDRLEEWPGFFVEDCNYIIHPRENLDAGLEGYWIYCESNAMLRDRIHALRDANVYNIHYDRHIISNVLVEDEKDGVYISKANYLVIQTDVEGHSHVFSAGEYRDKIVMVDGAPKFLEKVVVPDTFNIDRPLAVPL